MASLQVPSKMLETSCGYVPFAIIYMFIYIYIYFFFILFYFFTHPIDINNNLFYLIYIYY